jgi:hypothetical protein
VSVGGRPGLSRQEIASRPSDQPAASKSEGPPPCYRGSKIARSSRPRGDCSRGTGQCAAGDQAPGREWRLRVLEANSSNG